jgi:hypothetical protein
VGLEQLEEAEEIGGVVGADDIAWVTFMPWVFPIDVDSVEAK